MKISEDLFIFTKKVAGIFLMKADREQRVKKWQIIKKLISSSRGSSCIELKKSMGTSSKCFVTPAYYDIA